MAKSIEEMRIEREAAKKRIAEEKKAAKRKPPKPKKEKKTAEGGEEIWDSAIAPPRPWVDKKGKRLVDRNGQPALETYQLPSGEWSFSPKQLGAISLYSASANRLYGLDDKGRVNLKGDAYNTRVWFYYNRTVMETLATDPIAVKVRQRYVEIIHA